MGPVKKKKHLTPQIEQLMGVLGFDAVDLETNRMGGLSPRNVNRLWKRILARVLLLALSGIVVVGAMLGPPTDIQRIVLMVALVLYIVLFRYVGESIYACWKDLHAGALAVEGPVEVQAIRTGDASLPDYRLKMDNQWFSISWDVAAAFHNGDRYALYYTRRTRMLLAAEPLDEDQPAPSPDGLLSGFVPRLGAIFNFTPDDLAANAAGILTERQADALQAQSIHNTDVAWRMVLTAAGGGLVFYALVEVLQLNVCTGCGKWDFAALLVFVLTAVLAPVFIADRRSRREFDRVVGERRVAVVSGRLLVLPDRAEHRGEQVPTDLRVRGQQFNVIPGLHNVLRAYHWTPCSAYYVPGTHVLLSIGFESVPAA